MTPDAQRPPGGTGGRAGIRRDGEINTHCNPHRDVDAVDVTADPWAARQLAVARLIALFIHEVADQLEARNSEAEDGDRT